MALEVGAVIIGGGVTGIGILWDLSLRGIKCALVEKADLCNGASGRNHGLLHSGGRYAVTDPLSAEECSRENAILRRVASWAIDPCGGLFVRLESDDPSYAEKWVEGCHRASVPVRLVSREDARRHCPFLPTNVAEVFEVADAAIDVYRLVYGMAAAARSLGAEIMTRTEVTAVIVAGDEVRAVRVHSLLTGEEQVICSPVVINAAGAWAETVAQMVGCRVGVVPDRGILVVFNSRLSDCVINRLRAPSDGDIMVPSHNVSILGTTSGPTHDPDNKTVRPEEVKALLAAGSELLPDIRAFRCLRAYSGVRPLVGKNGGDTTDSRRLSRSFQVIDHGQKDGVRGFISSVGGKFTTFRLMAEETANVAATFLGVSRASATASTEIPAPEADSKKSLFATGAAMPVVCECENISAPEILAAARELEVLSFNDLRNRTRFAMGTCQGTFCAYRVAGLLAEGGFLPRGQSVNLLREFLMERWKGILPVLAGDQLREFEFSWALFTYTLGLELLPSEAIARGSAHDSGSGVRAVM